MALPQKAEAACTGNAVVCENQLPGSPASVWDVDGVGDTTIQGFATASSVNAGSKISFKIKTDARAYSIKVYRLGWYQGNGAREIATVTPSATLPQTQPSCATDDNTAITDCGTWAVSASWTVPSTAVSGVYLAHLIRSDTGGDSQIPFVVRNDGNTSNLVFQTSDTTWQAYNTYGGANFYSGGGAGRAYKVSYNRPYATRGLNSGRDYLFSNEYPMIRFLEQNGLDVSYVAGLDVGSDPTLLTKHKTFMSVGHDEYWTKDQRKNVTDARDAGVNLAFFGGNDVYWKSRWEPSQDGSNTPNRTFVDYKDTWANSPIDPVEATATWRDPRFGDLGYGYGPENALIGTQYQANFDDLAMQVNSDEGKLRLWRSTSLATMAAGTKATLSDHTIGYESNEDVDNGYRPDGLVQMSTTVGPTPEYLTDFGNTTTPGTTTHHVTLYRAGSGALVFSAGTIQWSWGLDSNHDGVTTTADPRMRQATLNILTDMGSPGTTVAPDLTQATASTDVTPPSVTVTAPASGSSATQGALLTVSGTASDVGGKVAGVEVSVDGGASFHPATGRESWTYSGILTGNGASAVQARATDDSARTSAPVKIALNSPCPCTLFGVAVPTRPDAADTDAVTLGTRFTTATDGFISGVRFYKSDANTGVHLGTLYAGNGTALANGTFTNETANGWQLLQFPTPVAVTAGTTYVAAYYAPKGHYAADSYYFERAFSAGALTAPGGTTQNGVFANGSAFPNQSYQQSNYYVDPVYAGDDTTPSTVTSTSPKAGASSVATTAVAKAVFSKSVTASSVMMQLLDGNQNPLPGALSYDPSTRTATFNPAQGLANSTTYTVTVSAAGMSAPAQWTFTTVAPDGVPNECPCTLFDESDQPVTAPANDNNRVQLGVAFSASRTGQITGVRFYKTADDLGPHTVALWSGATKVAEATTPSESTSGWQEADFDTPVYVTPGASYVASFTAPGGRYGVTDGGLANAITKGPLSTPASAGRYTYGTGVPNNTSTGNYFVDPVFEANAGAPPTVVAIAPGASATSVPVGRQVQATFSGNIQPGSATIVVKRSSDQTVVDGSTGSESQGSTATFLPSTDLDPGTAYSVTVSGALSLSGAKMTGSFTSSFTTSGAAACPCSLLESSATPVQSDSGDRDPVTLGLKFSPTVNGYIKGLRYYRDAANTGTHVGTLYNAGGDKLASVTFNDSGIGWQTAKFDSTVAVSAGTSYVAAYLAPNGHYSADLNYFDRPAVNNPLVSSAPSSLYYYGDGFPTQTYANTNYYVDVIFDTVDDGPPAVTSTTPTSAATAVPTTTAVAATFSRDINPTSLQLTLTDPSGQLVGGQLGYNATTRTATLTTAAPLLGGTVYTASANASSASGVAMDAPKTWTFTTSDTQPPATTVVSPAEGGTGAALGTKITATFAGPIDPASALFTVTRADTSATVTGTTTYDATSRTVTFTPSTALADYTGYNASVSARNTSGISMPAPKTWAFTTADTVAPTVTSTSPAAAATGVAAGAAVSAIFARDVDPTSVQLTLKTASGTAVAGSLAYTAATRTATFTPTAPLTSATSYTASASAKNRSGLAMASPTTWSFTAADTDPPTLSGRSPAAGATKVVATTTVTATFAKAISSSTLRMQLSGPGGAAISGTTTYNATTRVATFNPSAALTSSTAYSMSVSASSATNVAMAAPATWTFTTAAATYSLYATSRTPSATSTSFIPTTLGVAFSSSRSGSVTAIRYYAPSTNTGRTVKLYSPTRTVLGTATTTSTATGWRTATFATPIPITAGTSYVASYYAPIGRWSTTTSGYSTAYTSGPLSVAASGGRSGVGDAYPTTTSTTNFWVDVLVLI